MSQKKYKSADLHILTEGSCIDFDLYLTNETKTKMSVLIPKNSIIDGIMKVKLREIDKLYFDANDSERYDAYVSSHLQSVAKNPSISLEQKARMVYEKASEAMNAMFENPESLENVKTAQSIVGDCIHTVLNDNSTVESLMQITAHDYYTHTHSINVSIYTLSLGAFLGISGSDLEALGMAAILHDLGKSKVNYEIINKNGKLDDEEFGEMKTHPAQGHVIALKLGITDERILSGIRHHHERINGGGYPDNIQGDVISQFARIIGVCDVFDALSTRRSYKDPMTSFESLSLMKKEFAGHLDMSIVNSFIRMLRK
jgi:HD-GYP domain-containing protein (c-di-GMP phosphodiesterase class II)